MGLGGGGGAVEEEDLLPIPLALLSPMSLLPPVLPGCHSIPGPNLDTEMSVEFSVAFYSSTLHIYYLSLYWADLKC